MRNKILGILNIEIYSFIIKKKQQRKPCTHTEEIKQFHFVLCFSFNILKFNQF